MDLDVADRERAVAVDHGYAREHRLVSTERDQRAVGEIHRKIVATRQAPDAAGVVIVLVGDQDRGEIAGLETEPREPRNRFRETETAIDEEAGLPGLDE